MTEPTPPPDARTIVQTLARLLEAETFPRGDLAALRRMDPDAPGSTPILLRLLARHAPERLERDEAELLRWALVLHGMALMAPRHHHSELPVGRSLHGPNAVPLYAEARLARLLGARGPAFRALVPRLARQLKARDQALDWRELSGLILAEGRDEIRAERARERIARDYYRTEAKALKTEFEPMKEPA